MLIERGLADELRLKIHPVVLGAGKRLFGETSDKTPVRLLNSKTVDGVVAYLTSMNYYDTLIEVADDCPVTLMKDPRTTKVKPFRSSRA